MWQLRKLSTNEPLSEAGPLPNNWGPIFGLHGFQEKLGDLSWLGPSYADQGWVELTEAEQEESRKVKVMSRIGSEKSIANAALNNPEITIEQKIAWSEYLIALEHVCLCPDFDCNPKIPSRPRA
jgi:hypothetical protein